ncbi:MAG: hypothetical protein IH571_00925, partial [Acholeplasmataceae bacterium]|nr:hypothetical protein [Acholeplasmataceae bacterium]
MSWSNGKMDRYQLVKLKKTKRKTKKRLESVLGIPYYVVLIGLIVIPVAMMILYSFQTERPSGVFTISFTLEHYYSFFREIQFVRLMGESLYMA